MSKRIFIILFTSSYFLGLVAALTGFVIIFSTIMFFIVALLAYKKLIPEKSAIILFLVFAIGILNCSLRIKKSDYLSSFAPHNDVSVVGRVVSLPSSSAPNYTKFILDTTTFNLDNKEFMSAKSRTIVTLFVQKEDYKNIEIGDIISLKGRLTKPRYASNPSEFCYATYLKHKNIFSRMFVENDNYTIISKPEKQPYKFLSALNRLRNNIIDMHAQNIKSPELELLGGIVFGDDAVNPTPEMKVDFQNSGLTHIIAASGMNVTVIFGMWFFISQILRINYKVSIVLGMLSVICYTCMTGFGPPVLRAALMLLLILFGKLINRKADSISLLFIVAFIMLLFSPAMITNIGFQLSFTVTLGLMLFGPFIFSKINNKIISTLSSFIIIPIIAQFFASPIQMFYFNSFSPYSIFANIAVVPMLSVVSFGGFASCVLALIKPISSICVNLFDFILFPFLKFITFIASFFANLPNSSVVVPSPSLIQMIFYYLTLVTLFVLLITKQRRKIFVCVFSTLLLILCALCFTPKHSNYNEILFFSVENADCALIKTKGNKFILIDTGKAPYKNFAAAIERSILKYFEDKGIKKLDLLILSHYDSDHAGGAEFLLDKIQVSTILVRNKERSNNIANKILTKAQEKGIKVVVPENKEISYSDKDITIFSYYLSDGDDNETSIVNVLKTDKHTALFTGDTSAASLEKLFKYMPITNVDILKVPHHGAKNTLSKEILQKLKPKVSIISTGFNIYGHPSKETISLLKENKNLALRTDKDNAIKVVFHKNKILVYSYNMHRKIFERIIND